MCPKEICELSTKLSTKLLQQILATVMSGLYAFGHDTTSVCCEIIQALTKYVYTEIAKEQPRNDMMAPFLNVSFLQDEFGKKYVLS